MRSVQSAIMKSCSKEIITFRRFGFCEKLHCYSVAPGGATALPTLVYKYGLYTKSQLLEYRRFRRNRRYRIYALLTISKIIPSIGPFYLV
jgi:hypothetical protein